MSTVTLQQVEQHLRDIGPSDLDVRIVKSGDGFDLTPVSGGPYVSDVGSSYEVPLGLGDSGDRAGTAGPFTVYAYHPAVGSTLLSNFSRELTALATGEVAAVHAGVTAIVDDAEVGDCWLFGIRTEG